ncbi:suppressor of fused domain protein [Clostridium estertheticum]|uniref:suppressor of fused domain protein n=1 Tax=Clostridium estertheticum TaxID=238834 RepID=UPI001C0D6F09|nr:suppressor of fused domain protein [Clostridium estertheticum]MBU3185941.1 suppressor of fused domain protein [Clostridium estertheticum]
MSRNTVEELKKVMDKSPYFEYLYRNISIIGFNIINDNYNVLLIYKDNNISIEVAEKSSDIEPELWVEIDANELEELAVKNKPLTKFKIYTSNRGQILNEKIETIIQRMFMPPKDNKYPLEDIINLVYGGLLEFQEPRVAWRSDKKQLYVLKYKNIFDGLDLYITYGFTSPDLQPSALKLEQGKISGYGYELLMFAKQDDLELIKEFVDWVKGVDDTGNHIYQGQYLEYGEGVTIPGTDIAGFIILNPMGFPYTIPVSDGFGALNMFVGVTEKELKVVKQSDIYKVAQNLLEAGYVNYAPKVRESVV